MLCVRLLSVTVLMSLGLLPGEAFAQQSVPRGSVDARRNTASPQTLAPTPLPRGPLTITTPIAPMASAVPANPSPVTSINPTQPAGVPMGQSHNAAAPTNVATPANGASSANGPSSEQQANPEQLAPQQRRPTNQMLQNPSGAYHLTHTGIVTGQQIAPNLYFGRQYHDWSNLRNPSGMPASFGEMNRFQTSPFNGYISPNTYVGPGYSTWSNLSPGVVRPHSFGGWNYSVGW